MGLAIDESGENVKRRMRKGGKKREREPDEGMKR